MSCNHKKRENLLGHADSKLAGYFTKQNFSFYKGYTPKKCSWLIFWSLIALQVPNYYKIIKHPMNLNLVKRKLQRKHLQHYQSPKEFVYDVRLVFSNCAKYNEVSERMNTSAVCLSWGSCGQCFFLHVGTRLFLSVCFGVRSSTL